MSIKGPKDDVEKAKQQLLEQTNEQQLASFTDTVRANPVHHKFIIGKQGANIKKVWLLNTLTVKMKREKKTAKNAKDWAIRIFGKIKFYFIFQQFEIITWCILTSFHKCFYYIR